MTSLVTGVLWDKVEVLAANDKGTVHLGGNDSSSKDTATDGDETGERALLVWLRISLCARTVLATSSMIFSRPSPL